jgi:hypothetical protein
MQYLGYRGVVLLTTTLSVSSVLQADFKDTVRYNDLVATIGAVPDGAGFQVTQVEAPDSNNHYLPDGNPPAHSQFQGKTILEMSGPSGVSTHAQSVGIGFYGNTNSIAAGINTIESFEANDWINSGFLRTGSLVAPKPSQSRVANHSWIGDTPLPFNLEALERLDFVVETRDYIQVAGLSNSGNPHSTSTNPLLSSAYNVISVGRTDGGHADSTVEVGSSTLYNSGRVKPDLTAPESATSGATPRVSSAAVLLLDTAQQAGQVNGVRSEVIKAALMAGARREDINTQTNPFGLTYTIDSSNGLDRHFGAGELDVFNSYFIIHDGEHDSVEDGGGGDIGSYGFDYDGLFGGLNGSNPEATYRFSSVDDGGFVASLVWNIDIDMAQIIDGDGDLLEAATLYDMDLRLFDVTGGVNQQVAFSASDFENTENLVYSLQAGHDYLLKVERGSGQADFEFDYGLGWRINAAIPAPTTLLLIGFGWCGGWLGRGKRRGA